MELDFIKQLSKKLSVTCTLQPLVYRKKYAGYFFHSKKRTFLYFSLVYKSASQQSLQKKQEILILTNKPQEVQLLWQPKERGCHETLTVILQPMIV